MRALTQIGFTALAAALWFAAPSHAGEFHQHSTDEATALYNDLKNGGLIIYMRHERTNMLVLDQPDFDLADCSTQRNLSVAGIANAQAIRENITVLDVPIGVVLASPTCRTLETARYAFGKYSAEPKLIGGGRPMDEVAADLRQLMVSIPRGNENAVLVAHISNFEELMGVKLQEGDAAILTVGEGEPELLGVLSSNAWNDLVIDANYRRAKAQTKD